MAEAERVKRKVEGILFDWIIAEKPVSNIKIASQILTLIREEIEKVVNPYGTTKWTTVDEIKAFEECRHRILAFIKED